MNLEDVSFLFDNSELILLLRLLRCKNILFPSQEDEIDAEAALEKLREDQLVSGSREALAVDQVIAFLLCAMDSAAFCLCVSGGGYGAIFRTVLASLVLQSHGERWLIAPFRTFAGARLSMLRVLRKLRGPCILTLRNREHTETLQFQTSNEAVQTVEALLAIEEAEVKT